MYQESIRNLTEADRKMLMFELERCQRRQASSEVEWKTRIRQLLLKTFYIACLLLICLAGLAFLNFQIFQFAIRWFPFAAILTLIIYADRCIEMWDDYKFDQRAMHFRCASIKEMEQILSDEQVILKRIQTESVIEFRSPQDDSDGLAFDIGDNRVFLMHPGLFPENCDKTQWPNSDFEIVHVRDLVLSFGLQGTQLTPIRVLLAKQFDEDKFWKLKDGVIDTDLQSFVKSVEK